MSKTHTIYCQNAEEAAKVRSWLENGRGINVWISQELSSAGRTMYTPGDRNDKPHWSMELDETVRDPARIEIIDEEEVARKKALSIFDKAWPVQDAFPEEAWGQAKKQIAAYKATLPDTIEIMHDGILAVAYCKTKSFFGSVIVVGDNDSPQIVFHPISELTKMDRNFIIKQLLFLTADGFHVPGVANNKEWYLAGWYETDGDKGQRFADAHPNGNEYIFRPALIGEIQKYATHKKEYRPAKFIEIKE